jgi:hypothetical protein
MNQHFVQELVMKTKHYGRVTITALAFLFILFAVAPLEAKDNAARILPAAKPLTGFSHSAIGSAPTEEDKGEILSKFYSLQIPFVENQGQIKADGVRYYAKTLGGTVFVTKDGELVYSLPLLINPQSQGCVIKESPSHQSAISRLCDQRDTYWECYLSRKRAGQGRNQDKLLQRK